MMNWSQWLHQSLISATQITNEVPQGRILPASSLEAAPPDSDIPFIVMRWLPTNAGPWDGVSVSRFEVWVHDRGGSYERINRILDAVHARVVALLPEQDSPMTGRPHWEGRSEERVDDALNTITRYESFRVAGKVVIQ